MNPRRRAFTLAEVLVAGALATAILGVIIYLFVQFRRDAERPLASTDIEQSTFVIMRWLQRDLAETNLQSLYSLPNHSGLIMESPRDTNDKMIFSAFGTVEWQKYVFYQVKPTPFDKPLPSGVTVGELNYDERLLNAAERATYEPTQPTDLTPSGLTNRHKELGRNFMIQGGMMGCYVYWTDPSNNSEHEYNEGERREPVCVSLNLIQVSGATGKPTMRNVFMQVKPKN